MIKNATVQLPEIQVVKILKGSHYPTPNATAELAAKASSTCSKTRSIRLAAQKVNAPQRNVSYQAGWGKGGNREGQAACLLHRRRWRVPCRGTLRRRSHCCLGRRGLQEDWRSAQRSLTWVSATIVLDQPGQRALLECLDSANRCHACISSEMRSDQLGQGVLHGCCRSAQLWLTSISGAMVSGMLGHGCSQEFLRSARCCLSSMSASMRSTHTKPRGFELRGVVKHGAFVCRHLAQLALCHLFSRRGTRKRDILYTYRVVVFGFALSLWTKPV